MGQAFNKGKKPNTENQNEENVEKVNGQSGDPQDKINENVSKEIEEGMICMVYKSMKLNIKHLQIPLPSIIQTLLLLVGNCTDRISLS